MRHRIRLPHIPFTLKHLVWQGIKGIVCQAGIPHDDGFLQETQHLDLHHHIINGQHPLACRQLRELLDDTHILHEIHTALTGNRDITTFHLITGVLEDIDIPPEAEVLHVIGKEMQMDATVTLDLQSVLDIETVKADGTPADR